MQDYTKLLIWQRARALTVAVSQESRSFKAGGAPGLRSQLMRATMSISATIAEGAGRETRADFARFINMAIASSNEVEHHLQVSNDLGLLDEPAFGRVLARSIEVRRMLFGFHKALLRAEKTERGKQTVQRSEARSPTG
jgi:four helix bundle protein